jgi:hypothetical protein|uniref:Uncharacterized protein n=1 Tax=Eutreptiella gymnastica TaxID=73025 RepID=A0A6T1Z2Y8_9EUGL
MDVLTLEDLDQLPGSGSGLEADIGTAQNDGGIFSASSSALKAVVAKGAAATTDLDFDDHNIYQKFQKFRSEPPSCPLSVKDDQFIPLNATQCKDPNATKGHSSSFVTPQPHLMLFSLPLGEGGPQMRRHSQPIAKPLTFNVFDDLRSSEEVEDAVDAAPAVVNAALKPPSICVQDEPSKANPESCTSAALHDGLPLDSDDTSALVFTNLDAINAFGEKPTTEVTDATAETGKDMATVGAALRPANDRAGDEPPAGKQWYVLDHKGRVVESRFEGCAGAVTDNFEKSVCVLDDLANDELVRALQTSDLPLQQDDDDGTHLLPTSRPTVSKMPKAENSPLRPETFNTMYASLMSVMSQYL